MNYLVVGKKTKSVPCIACMHWKEQQRHKKRNKNRHCVMISRYIYI